MYFDGSFFFFLLWFNVPVNNFSVKLRRSHLFLGITSTFWGVNVPCSRKQHTGPVEDRTRVSRSGVRRSNMEVYVPKYNLKHIFIVNVSNDKELDKIASVFDGKEIRLVTSKPAYVLKK